MGCNGSGMLGVYKLEIDLKIGEIRFFTKIEIGHCDRMQAAGLMDFTFQYYKRLSIPSQQD